MDTSRLQTLDSLPMLASQTPHDALNDRTQDLPPEIMANIFTLLGVEVLIPPRKCAFPWVIGRVCSRWRQILWHGPSPWNRVIIQHPDGIVFEFEVKEATGGKYDVGGVLNYIFSKTSGPISLTALGRGSGYLKGLPDVILNHSYRLKELAIHKLQHNAISSMLDLPPGAFVQLEKLLLPDLYIGEHFRDRTISPLQTAPRLRCVMYDTWTPFYCPTLLLLPWDTIENIEVRQMRIPPDMIWHILQSCPSLISCSLLIEDEPFLPNASEIMLPAVEVLEFHTEGDFEWDSFLSMITTPSLTSLTLISPHIPYTSFVSLITRSHCSITNLDIFATDLHEYNDDIDAGVFLDYFPRVRKLAVPWPIPPSMLGSIHAGAFPELARAKIVVRPDGLGAFLDIVDSYIDPPRRWPGDLTMTIAYCEGPGLVAQKNRYLTNEEAYNSVKGLIFGMFSLGGIINCGYSDD